MVMNLLNLTFWVAKDCFFFNSHCGQHSMLPARFRSDLTFLRVRMCGVCNNISNIVTNIAAIYGDLSIQRVDTIDRMSW